ncbi:MAG: hypothetical protein JNJ57_03960 [Saprospiraceae bacterium]|nr:hypothetical protein [Saprospiraceae bacterium]
MTIRKFPFKSCFLLAGLLLILQSVQAQTTNRNDKEDESPNRSRIWYGGGLLLGFNSYFGANIFSFGLSPMVGYKILPALSVGPRVEFIYTSYKEIGFKSTNLFDVDAGVFVRGKVFRGLFLQGELSNQWYENPIGANEKERLTRFNQRIGAGWNWSSGQAGSEIGVFYNFAVANDLNTYQNPLTYRFGFTWNF